MITFEYLKERLKLSTEFDKWSLKEIKKKFQKKKGKREKSEKIFKVKLRRGIAVCLYIILLYYKRHMVDMRTKNYFV